MTQGLLSFQYEEDASSAGLTAMAGLPLYLELMVAAKLGEVIRRHLKVRLKQGWSDVQHIISLVLLNLAGGDCLDDLEVLEADRGFGRILRTVEVQGLRYRQRRGCVSILAERLEPGLMEVSQRPPGELSTS